MLQPGIVKTYPSTMRVCQFHHTRKTQKTPEISVFPFNSNENKLYPLCPGGTRWHTLTPRLACAQAKVNTG